MHQRRAGKTKAAVTVLFLVTALAGCSSQEPSEKDFVGKWQSSRAKTPIYLYSNGEWELKDDDGTELQYGVWQLVDKKIMWSVIMDDTIGHDLNPLVSFEPKQFSLRETTGAVTTFRRLD